MGQYFEYNPNLKSNIKEIKYDLLGNKLIFNADNGVFSKDRVDFGTNVLLNSLPDFRDKKHLVDVGCGYGVIGICLAKGYPNLAVDMVDINQSAVDLTKENIKRNRVSNAFVYESNLYEYYEKEKIDYKYDVLISNPPIRAGKKIVHDIALLGYDLLADFGEAYFVIQKKQGALSLLKAMEDEYQKAEIINKQNGYLILKGTKMITG